MFKKTEDLKIILYNFILYKMNHINQINNLNLINTNIVLNNKEINNLCETKKNDDYNFNYLVNIGSYF